MVPGSERCLACALRITRNRALSHQPIEGDASGIRHERPSSPDPSDLSRARSSAPSRHDPPGHQVGLLQLATAGPHGWPRHIDRTGPISVAAKGGVFPSVVGDPVADACGSSDAGRD